MRFPDTIVALSSGPLPAGVAIVRISGSESRFVAETIAGVLPIARMAGYRMLRAKGGEAIDSGLVLFFPGPASFTGEDVVEFQVHGGRAVVAKLLETLVSFENVRHAEQGEFTRRAFLNGRLDLTETEGLADLINAETEAQRRMALSNAGGAQSELYAAWRKRLIHARAMIEAEIDFADEDDVPGSVADAVWADVRAMVAEIAGHVDGYRSAEIIRDGYDVVIVGPPNVGKSSLLNALARREVAIVTDQAGTTRDLIEIALDLQGLRVRITDTAGLREGIDLVESIGIERAHARARSADLVLMLEGSDQLADMIWPEQLPDALRVRTKIDLCSDSDLRDADLAISVKSGEGIATLVEAISTRAAAAAGMNGEVLPSRARHVELLKSTQTHLSEAVSDMLPAELRCESLRHASDSLGRITGSVDVEDLLDVIFSQFCIGK